MGSTPDIAAVELRVRYCFSDAESCRTASGPLRSFRRDGFDDGSWRYLLVLNDKPNGNF